MGGLAGRSEEGRAGRIDLAREGAIRLGRLTFEPGLLRVAHQDGREQIVQPRVMQVLVALARAGGKIVSRDDLIVWCWDGVVVGEDSINRVISLLRRLCETLGEGELRLETIARVGYRLTEAAAEGGGPGAQPGQAGEAPSLAVLPFANRSDLPEDDVFAQGMVEDVISALAQGVNVRVLGSASTAGLGQDSLADPAALGCRLGVRYLLEGSVRRQGDYLRVTTRLLDAATGAVEWSGKFDRPLAELAALQEDLVVDLAASLDARVASLEMDRALRKPRDLTAWEAVVRSQAAYRNANEANLHRAFEEAQLAVAIAPDYGLAYAQLAFTRALLYVRTSPHDDAEIRAIREIADRALALAPEDAFVLSSIGGALTQIGFAQDARSYLLRSLRRMPGNGMAHMNLALALNSLNRPDEALAHLDTAARLLQESSFLSTIHAYRCNAFLLAGRWDEAEAAIDAAIALDPVRNRGIKALICRHAGRDAEARREFELFRRSGLSLKQMVTSRRRMFASNRALSDLIVQHLRALWEETEPRQS